MPYIHPDTVDKARDAAQVIDVVSHFVPDLKKVGGSYKGKSPFTEENTPSFYVHPVKNIFKCFSSGYGGDAIKFLMLHQNHDFYQAISWIAEKYNISQKAYTPTEEEKQEIDKRETLYKLNEAALQKWRNNLWGGGLGLANEYKKVETENWPFGDYWSTNHLPSVQNPELEENHIFREIIYKRTLTRETVIDFEIGYAPDTWEFLSKIIKEKGLTNEASELGIIGKSQRGHYFDKLRHRLIFPIRNYRGRIVGFGAGALYYEKGEEKKAYYEYIDGEKHLSPEKEPIKVGKYLNSPETPLYDKSGELYGIHLAKESISKSGCAYLTEGYFDVITPYQNGLTNTVASCGTELTKKQIHLLLKYTDRIVIMYDGDNAGRKKAIKAAELLINEGLSAEIVDLPAGEDPDSFFRSNSEPIKYIKDNTVHALLFKADFELTEDLNHYERETCFKSIANLIAAIDGDSIKDQLIKDISKDHGITAQVLRKMVADFAEIRRKKVNKDRLKKRKNEVVKLEGKPEVYPFFSEKTDKDGTYKGIDVNKLRFIKLLQSFGYSRFEIDDSDVKTFVRIKDSLIYQVKRDEIIDHFEDFVNNEYNFEEAGFLNVDAEELLNKFYDGMRTYFSSDLFGRVRNSTKILVNKDKKDTTYFYYKNGFVEINEEGWKMLPYDEMEGGIWDNQRNERDFEFYEVREKDISVENTGVFSDFVWKISGEEPMRFAALCTVIGYIVHDFYHYTLQLVNFTDSSVNSASDGRSGKTLLTKMIGKVRNVGEINGKDFRTNDKSKYANLDLYTQITVINDIITKGRDKLYFEDLFNDITEGQMVKKLYMDPFHLMTKMIICSNGPLDYRGGSASARLIEYELSQYFSSKHSPYDEYGMSLGQDFDQREWMLYDNFMCYCAHQFHKAGIISPPVLNLGRRKLIAQMDEYVLRFLDETRDTLKETKKPWDDYITPNDWPAVPEFTNIKINKKEWYEKMCKEYTEINQNFVSQHRFTKYLQLYAQHEFGIQNPIDKRSGGVGYFHFQETPQQ